MTQVSPKATRRPEFVALWGGIAVSLLFTLIIWITGSRLASIPHLPDYGPDWYYWQLPEATAWSRASAWVLYALHQIAIWALIYRAQTRIKRTSPGLHGVNVAMLGVNALFVLLHLAQTHLWYDGLAQDVSVFSSQGSVILMLVMVLLMENARRGLFFGKKVSFSQEIIRVVRSYHGYVFAWATIYTFWYHPMENTQGHLIGFFYMFLLFLQGSLAYTRVHVNRWWTLAQEAVVLPHGTLVAVMQGNGIWPMFAFGFGGILLITQMHGLGLPRWSRWAIAGVYVALALIVYSQRGWVQLNEIVRIPIIEYVLVFVLAGIIWVGLWLLRLLRGRKPATESSR